MRWRALTPTLPLPCRKTISTTITTSTPQVCLPSDPLTHPPACPPTPHLCALLTPPTSAVPMAACDKFEVAQIYFYGMYWSPSSPSSRSPSLPSSSSSSLIPYVAFRRHSSPAALEWPLYYMGWCESLSWTEKIITEIWCSGEASELLIREASQRSLKRVVKSLAGPVCIRGVGGVVQNKWSYRNSHVRPKHISDRNRISTDEQTCSLL